MSVQTIKKAESSSVATKAFFVSLLWSLLGLLQANAQAPIDQVALDNQKFLTVRDLVVVDCGSSIEGPLALPSDIIAVGAEAFEGCYGLTSLTLSASLQQVGEGAFRGCYSLEKIQVENGNTFFRSSDGILFSYDFQKIVRYPPVLLVPSFKIRNSVTHIGDDAFSGCRELKQVHIPESDTNAG